MVQFHLIFQITLRGNLDFFSRGREMGVGGRDLFIASEQPNQIIDFHENLHEYLFSGTPQVTWATLMSPPIPWGRGMGVDVRDKCLVSE